MEDSQRSVVCICGHVVSWDGDSADSVGDLPAILPEFPPEEFREFLLEFRPRVLQREGFVQEVPAE